MAARVKITVVGQVLGPNVNRHQPAYPGHPDLATHTERAALDCPDEPGNDGAEWREAHPSFVILGLDPRTQV
jgi:hypothetical protein